MFGGSNAIWNGVPLPLSLAVLGQPACTLLVSPDVPIPMIPDGTGARFSFPVPAAPTLLNTSFYVQAIGVRLPAGQFELTDAAELRVGRR